MIPELRFRLALCNSGIIALWSQTYKVVDECLFILHNLGLHDLLDDVDEQLSVLGRLLATHDVSPTKDNKKRVLNVVSRTPQAYRYVQLLGCFDEICQAQQGINKKLKTAFLQFSYDCYSVINSEVKHGQKSPSSTTKIEAR